MFKLYTLFILISPLIGIVLMEMGMYGLSVYEKGYPNNASFAYLYYLLVTVLFIFIALRTKFKKAEVNHSKQAYSRKTLVLITLVNASFLLILLFFFGGVNVWLGSVGKGEFRVGLGFFGAIAFIITKYAAPLYLAYLSACYHIIKLNSASKVLFYLNFLLVFLIGSTWGYKSTAIMLLLPSIVILFWNAPFRKALVFSLIAFISMVLFSVLFDNRSLSTEVEYTNLSEYTEVYQGGGSALELVVYRATVLQGDVSWKIWDLYNSDFQFPNYFKTWISVMGDKNLSILLDVSRDNFDIFLQYHYSYLLTYLAGASIYQISEGYNVTGTAFSEGLIAGGIIGVTLFAAFAGFLIGFLFRRIKNGIGQFDPLSSSFYAMYYVTVFTPWLVGGDISGSFLHIGVLAGISLSYFSLKYIIRIHFVWN